MADNEKLERSEVSYPVLVSQNPSSVLNNYGVYEHLVSHNIARGHKGGASERTIRNTRKSIEEKFGHYKIRYTDDNV